MNPKGRTPLPPQSVVVCLHTDRKKKARGLCNVCYNKFLYKTSEKHRKRVLKQSSATYYRRKENGTYYTGMRRDRLRRYGLTIEQYSVLLQKQNGVCAICGQTESTKTKANLAVDHEHGTGKVRGLLCMMCNTGIGKFSTREILQRAISYLEASA